MSNNIIKDRIEREANALIKNMYGADVAKIRRQAIAFSITVANIAKGADSYIDPILRKVQESKYSTAIVAVAVAAIAVAFFSLGVVI